MYGLKEAAILAYNRLLLHLKPRGYYSIPSTAGFWYHKNRKAVFFLCVDDFIIKYYSQEDVQYFQDSFKNHFKFHIDRKGGIILG